MKIRIKEWEAGGQTIFAAFILAIASLFMTWVDMDGVRSTGLEEKGYLFLIFYIYPMYKLLKNEPMHKIWGKLSSILAIVFVASFLGSVSLDELGNTIDAGGTGLYLFLSSSILLNVGTIRYKVVEEKTTKGKKNSKKKK